jgi:hypothetical protein
MDGETKTRRRMRDVRVYVCGCRQWGPNDHGTCLTCNEEIHTLCALPLYGPQTFDQFMVDWNDAEMDEYHREQMRVRPAHGLRPLDTIHSKLGNARA